MVTILLLSGMGLRGYHMSERNRWPTGGFTGTQNAGPWWS